MEKILNYINGELIEPSSKIYIENIDPSCGKAYSLVPDSCADDVNEAVKSAKVAYSFWSKTTKQERSDILNKLADAIEENFDMLVAAESRDNGKPLSLAAKVDIPRASANLRFFAGAILHDSSDVHEMDGEAINYTLRVPIGVAACISPWNLPLYLLTWKIAPALATGNTVVLKPAETTPLTALLFAEICEQAGLPPGVVNIVTGDGSTGSLIVNHKDINKIAFTGSTQVGKLIQKSLAGRDVGLTLELGGKAANIVYEDAAIDQAVEGVVNGIFFNQGHVCCAGSRLLLQESIHDEFVKKLEKRMQSLRVGNPLDKNTDIGAINSKEQLDKITGLVNEGVEDGGELFQAECELPGNGFWFRPTLFTNVQPSYSIAREEIFGPVLTTLTFRTPEEAVEIANNTEYGLSAGVWTEKGSKILWTADRLEAGVVWANTFNKFDPSSPFGGYKESGFGREGGRHGLLSYLKASS